MEKKLSYKISGLDCAEEVALLRRALQHVDGVQRLDFNILEAKMQVTFDTDRIHSDKIISLVAKTGLKAKVWEKRGEEKQKPWQRLLRPISCLLSLLLLIAGTVVHYLSHQNVIDLVTAGERGHLMPVAAKILYLLSMISGLWMVVPKAYFAVRQIRPDINLLMVIAVIGAIGIGEWFEAATVAFLFSLSLLLEELSVERARKAVTGLLDLAPQQAQLFDPITGKIEEKAVEEVGIGSTILVRPGEKVPLDGVVAKGSSSIDQSPITGESLPLNKDIGDEVFAGTLNQDGAIEVTVTKEVRDTTLSKIIHLVEEARSKRSKNEQWVEKFAHIYTPLMILIALFVILVPPLFFGGVWFDWIYRGLVLLVIACPCALVISTPVSIVSALTSAARHGVLIKGGVFLELIGQIKALALDKTGTLTLGHPEVQKIVPLNGHTEEELLFRCASLEQKSEHPLARAILKKAEEAGISISPAENFEIVRGKGAQGIVAGKKYWIGSHRFMHEMGQETNEIHDIALSLEDAGHSVIAIGTDDHVCGLLSLADSPRMHIKQIIQTLKNLGIEKIVMLTGDNEPTAKALAELTGVDEYFSELLPEDKVAAIDSLEEKYQRVAMVGDGVNDAPALARANLGIAMGGMGTDAAIETADIALMSDDLAKVPWLIKHARRSLSIIKQNISFSLIVKAVFIVLALLELATLWMAIAADTGATLVVIFNALRLLKIEKKV